MFRSGVKVFTALISPMVPMELRQGAAHGGIIDQNHCLPGQRVLHREASVAESLYGEGCTFQLQHGSAAVPARPKQNSSPRSTASTAPQHSSSRPGDSGR